jgi:signal transduction histidine kinase
LRLKALPKEVQVVVEDHGQGIPKEDIAKLFKPFSRADVSTTGGEKAVGLGLAICKRVVEGHEGRIWIESSVGQGTKVYVTLPYTRPNMRP